jgi:hypothetical protein
MLSKRVTITFLLISSITLLAAMDAQSQTLASARILSSDGPVEIQRRSQGEAALMKIAYRVNDELVAGDVIKTFKGGRLVLGLVDGSQAIISEKTVVEIVDLSQSPRTIFNLLRGKTRIKIEKVGGRPNPYRVNTPTAVIAVRGTLFDVLVTDKETQVFVHEGEVAVSNLAAPQVLVILSPGQRTRVQEARPPETPSQFQPGRNNDTFKPHPSDKGPNGGPRGERDGNSPSSGQPGEHDGQRQPDHAPVDANGPTQRQPGGDSRRDAPPAGNSSPGGHEGGGSRRPERFFPDID